MTLGVAAPGSSAATTADDIGGDIRVSIWLWVVAALVVAMVAVGGATRLTDSGLSITEWQPILGAIPPLTDADWQAAFDKYRQIPEYQQINKGMSLEAFKTIFWWEWGHRFLGRIIGLAFALPLLVFWLLGYLPKGSRLPLAGLLVLGGLQGFMGWFMVQSGLTERVDVSHYRLAAHLGLAFVILGALVWMALLTWPRDPLARLQTRPQGLWVGAAALVVLMFAQVILGAFVAGTKAGLVYTTWPLMNGQLVPDSLWMMTPWYLNPLENLTTIQFNHRIMAYVIVLVAAVQIWCVLRSDETQDSVRRSGLIMGLLVLAQAGLGIWTLLASEGRNAIPIGLGVLHQTTAAVLFAFTVWHLFAATRGRRF